MTSQENWDWEIDEKKTSTFNKKELWSYRHLLTSLIERDFILNNQQTILGPFWTLLQPIITLVTYVFVFGKLVGISTGTLPPVLFYYSGIILWNFFSDSFMGASGTFKDNLSIFSKVYLPRLIMPLSTVSTHFLRFLIQLFFLLLIIAYFYFFKDYSIHYDWYLLLSPVAVIAVGSLGLGLGLFCSLLAAKYKDLFNLIGILVRLLMFLTPVLYPLATLNKDLQWIVKLNPLTSFFELFRRSLLGEGMVYPPYLFVSLLFTILILMMSIKVFNRQSNRLMDVI